VLLPLHLLEFNYPITHIKHDTDLNPLLPTLGLGPGLSKCHPCKVPPGAPRCLHRHCKFQWFIDRDIWHHAHGYNVHFSFFVFCSKYRRVLLYRPDPKYHSFSLCWWHLDDLKAEFDVISPGESSCYGRRHAEPPTGSSATRRRLLYLSSDATRLGIGRRLQALRRLFNPKSHKTVKVRYNVKVFLG